MNSDDEICNIFFLASIPGLKQILILIMNWLTVKQWIIFRKLKVFCY